MIDSLPDRHPSAKLSEVGSKGGRLAEDAGDVALFGVDDGGGGGVALEVAEAVAEGDELFFELDAGHVVGEVAACALKAAAGDVGAAAEAAGDGVGEVHGDEEVVDVVHDGQDLFAAIELVLAEEVEDVAAELADGFGHAVEVGGGFDAELVGRRDGLVDDDGVGDAGLGVLLFGVLDEAAIVDVGAGLQGVAGGGEEGFGLGQAGIGFGELAAVDGADGEAAMLDDVAALGEALLARPVDLLEALGDRLADVL